MPIPAPTFIRSVLVPPVALVASSTAQFEMGVNPISHLDIIVDAIVNGAQGALTGSAVMAFLSSIRVTGRGVALYDASGPDAMAISNFILRKGIRMHASPATSSQIIRVGVTIPFSRSMYMLDEGLPGFKRGDLLLELDTGALPGTMTSANVKVIQHEILAGNPTHYLRSTTLSFTPAATGDVDIDLPLGNVMTGITLFGTTVPTAAVTTASIERARLLLDNQEWGIVSARWDDLTMMAALRNPYPLYMTEHEHVENLAAAYAQFPITGPINDVSSTLGNYGYMDFDPTGDMLFSPNLAEPASAVCRINAGATDAIRLIPHNILPSPLTS